MPTEPERDIEKTLRAYADKRREQAGAPVEMHPATRKMLQGEIAKLRKLAPQPRVVGFWEKLWGGSWPRFAIRFAVVVVVLAVAAVLIVPEFSTAKRKQDLAMVRQQGRESASVNRENSKDATADRSRMVAPEMDMAPAASPTPSGSKSDVAVAHDLRKESPYGGVAESDVPSGDKKLPAESPARSYALKTAPAGRLGEVETAAAIPPPAPAALSAGKLVAKSDGFTNSVAVNESGKLQNSEGNTVGNDFATSRAATSTIRLAAAPAPVVSPGDLSLNASAAPNSAPAFNFYNGVLPPPSNYIEMVRRSNLQSAKLALNEPTVATVSGGNFAAVAPAQNNTFADSVDALSKPVAQGFVRAAQPAIANRKLRAVNKAVLNSFKLEQNGQVIRVIDGDGSVYVGQLGWPSEEKATTETYTVTPGHGSIGGSAAEQQKQLLVVTNNFYFNNNGQQQQGYFFRVNGTNRSLRQLVDFSGSLIPLAQDNASGGSSRDQSKSLGLLSTSPAAATPASLQWQLLNSQIQGQAIIGGSNKLEINAMPAKK